MNQVTERLNWIDALKGIAILLVVFGHTLDGAPMYNSTKWMLNLHSFIYCFHMPLFFFLSGCTFALSKKNSEQKLLWIRILDLLLIYIFWSYLMYLGKAVLKNEVNKTIDENFFYCLLFSPVGIYWYLITLIFYSILGGFILHLKKTFFCIIFIISLFISTLLTFFHNSFLTNELKYLYKLLFHFSFFICGIFYIKFYKLKPFPKILKYIVFIFCIGLIILKLFSNINIEFIFSFILAWLCISSLIIFVYYFPQLCNKKSLNFCGFYSLYIYLIHNFITVTSRVFLKNKITSGGEYVCVVFLITIILCICIILICNKITILNIFFRPIKTLQNFRGNRSSYERMR